VELREVQAHWEEAAKTDAFGTIMTVPGMTQEEFWETGRADVGVLVDDLEPDLTSVLDFGCGVGRLTRAFADRTNRATGVDVSPTMIRLAKDFDNRPDYRLNALPDLGLFNDNSFSFTYSTIVLQHMPPELAKCYVKEFLRVTSGLVSFQLPEGGTNVNGALSMFGTPRHVVEEWLARYDVRADENKAAGAGFTSYRYTVAC